MRLPSLFPFVFALPLLLAACGDDHDELSAPSDKPDASGGSCESSADCSGATPVCDELASLCVQCLFDTQCDGDEVCGDRVCVQQTTCETSLDCVEHAPRTICDTASSTCVECVQAADCDGTADCTNNRCVPYVSCDTSLDCPTGQVCAKAQGRCVECETAADCPDGDECISNECKTITPCVSDNQCTPAGQLCDKALGYCVDCLNDEQCPDAYHCSSLGECEVDTCEAGATRCEGNAIVTCDASGGAWGTPQPCPSRNTCKQSAGAASCRPWICDPGLSTCEGDVAQTCSDDGLSVESSKDCAALDQHCFGGACSDQACSPGTAFCEGNDVHTCNGAGTGSTVTDTCGASEYCDAASASCKPTVCEPGAPACDGSVATVCNAIGSGYAAGGTDCAVQGMTCSAGVCSTAPAGNCGWSAANSYYACGFQGEDPSGQNPIACPPGLQVNGACGSVTQVGCCDENGDNWYCNAFFLTKESCAPPTPPEPGVKCESAACDPGQLCCFEGTSGSQCLSSGSTCSGGTPIHCDGPEDCGGQICCGESVAGQSYNVVECRPGCSETDNIVFCNPQGADVCSAYGKTCGASAVLSGYYICR